MTKAKQAEHTPPTKEELKEKFLCDACCAVGACRDCWGMAAITELKRKNDELVEACRHALTSFGKDEATIWHTKQMLTKALSDAGAV